jgi:hypothetical protein
VAEVLGAPLCLAAVLSFSGGFGKIRRPLLLSISLERAGLFSAYWFVRLVASVEIGVGVLALVLPNRYTAACLAVLFLVFGMYILWLLLSGEPGLSCGCSSNLEVRPTVGHALFNLALATACGLAASVGPVSLVTVIRSAPEVAPIFVLALGSAWLLAETMIEYLPQLAPLTGGERRERGERREQYLASKFQEFRISAKEGAE